MSESPQPETEQPDVPPTETDQKYFPEPGEAQLTSRAVIAGCVTGSVVACTNVYIGLKIGWSFGASIVAAVLSYALFSMTNRRLSVLETNIAQTTGSAAGSMAAAAGLLAPIPAMAMLGHEIPAMSLVLWALAVSFLGVFFAVPLRRQFVEVDKLRFPTGTATAETVLAMYGEAGDATAKARALIWAGLGAGAFVLCAFFVPQLESPPLQNLDAVLGISALTVAASWSFKVYLGPALFGAGFLIGPRVVLSLVLGAVLSWGILGPFAQYQGLAPGKVMSYADGPRGWILWPGVALMVTEALTSLGLSWRTLLRALRLPAASDRDDKERIPGLWWIGGLCCGSILTMSIAWFAFDIPWYLSLVAIALSTVLSAVATRSLGETDINPIGGVGKVTQLVFGGIAPGQVTTNLMAAAITGGGASQAADMMQDLKAGHLLGASPRKQFIAQLWGICAGIILVVPVYTLFTTAYDLGSDELPAPAAKAWQAMAVLLADGFDALPSGAPAAVGIAAAIGVLLPILRRNEKFKPYVPSGLAVGIAFIIPAFYSLVMLYGLGVYYVWKWLKPDSVDKYTFAVASGLIAGEGLMGIVNAALTIFGVKPLT